MHSQRGDTEVSSILGYYAMLSGEQLLMCLRNAVPPFSHSSSLLGLFVLGEAETILS
jgi:hypothetical protein